MSNSKKITDLAAYTDSQVQSNDLLFITDIAAQETKKITTSIVNIFFTMGLLRFL